MVAFIIPIIINIKWSTCFEENNEQFKKQFTASLLSGFRIIYLICHVKLYLNLITSFFMSNENKKFETLFFFAVVNLWFLLYIGAVFNKYHDMHLIVVEFWFKWNNWYILFDYQKCVGIESCDWIYE